MQEKLDQVNDLPLPQKLPSEQSPPPPQTILAICNSKSVLKPVT